MAEDEKSRDKRIKKEKKLRDEQDKKERERVEKLEKKLRKEKEKQDKAAKKGALLRSRSTSSVVADPAPQPPSALRDSTRSRDSSSSSRKHVTLPPPKTDDAPTAVLARTASVRGLEISSPLSASQTRVLAVPPPLLSHQQAPPISPGTPPEQQPLSMSSRKPTAEQDATSPPIQEQSDCQCKVVLCGAAGVGKTCWLRRLHVNEFEDGYAATIGVEFRNQYVSVPGNLTMRAQIWDTAGQERFNSITSIYYRGCLGAIVFFDRSVKESFENVGGHVLNVQNLCGAPTPEWQPLIMIVANKCDLPSAVDMDMVTAWCLQRNYLCYETSAKTGHLVVAAFHEFARIIYEQRLRKTLVTAQELLALPPPPGASVAIHPEQHPSGAATNRTGCRC